MAIAKWSTVTTGSNIASTLLNSVGANAGNSARIPYDNSTNRALYARVRIVLGSFNPNAGGSIILSTLLRRDGTNQDIVDTLESYVAAVPSGASIKRVDFPLVRLYPFDMGFIVRNRTSAAFASSGNEFYVDYYNEDVT